jgi:hypothetical protein
MDDGAQLRGSEIEGVQGGGIDAGDDVTDARSSPGSAALAEELIKWVEQYAAKICPPGCLPLPAQEREINLFARITVALRGVAQSDHEGPARVERVETTGQLPPVPSPGSEYVLMPKEATRTMTMAGCDSLPSCEHVFGYAGEMLRNAYRKMVEVGSVDVAQAAPEPDGYNGCYRVAIEALNYLASHTRPAGGQERFNAEHLLQIADEMKRPRASSLPSTPRETPELADRWPLGCHSPNSCSRNGRCMYFGCRHDGKDIKALATAFSPADRGSAA